MLSHSRGTLQGVREITCIAFFCCPTYEKQVDIFIFLRNSNVSY